MTSGSDRLISSLVDDLEPVRLLPRLRFAYAVLLAIWAILLGLVLWTNPGELGLASLFTNRIYLGSFVGLLVAAFGGTCSALAAGVPGREKLEIGGMGVALVGLLVAVVVCLLGMVELGPAAVPSPEGADTMCFRESVLLSLLPAVVIFGFLFRGWAADPRRAALLVLLASGALGAMIVHMNCGLLSPRHMLVSHLSVPFVLILLGIYPLAVVLRRVRR